MKRRSLQSYPVRLDPPIPKMTPVAVKKKRAGRNKKLYTSADFERTGSILSNIEDLRRR